MDRVIIKKADNIKQELIDMGAEVFNNHVKLYRGGDVPEDILYQLRYNKY